MHPGTERIWDISYWRKQLMQHMMFIGQYLSKQFVILFLANMNERNLFRQKAKTVVQFSAPQDSVLGPLFFILYTADVFHIAEELGFFIHGYADDLQLYDHCLACDTAQLSVHLAHCINPWANEYPATVSS